MNSSIAWVCVLLLSKSPPYTSSRRVVGLLSAFQAFSLVGRWEEIAMEVPLEIVKRQGWRKGDGPLAACRIGHRSLC